MGFWINSSLFRWKNTKGTQWSLSFNILIYPNFRSPSTAQPWLSLALFEDLMRPPYGKDVVLVRADHLPQLSRQVGIFDCDSFWLLFDCHCLKQESFAVLEMVTSAYLNDELFQDHIQVFNSQPSSFSFEKYTADFKSHFSQLFKLKKWLLDYFFSRIFFTNDLNLQFIIKEKRKKICLTQL